MAMQYERNRIVQILMRWTTVDEMNEMGYGLKEMRWNIKNEVDNVTPTTLLNSLPVMEFVQ